MKKIAAIVCTLFLCMVLKAQDPHFSQFFASPLTLNPAFTGKFDGQLRLTANHRDQWPSIPKAYVTTSASVDFAILKKNLREGDVLGIGISGVSDQSADAALKLNYGSLSLSFHKALDEDGYNTIGAGFQATYSSIGLDVNKLTFEDQLTQNGFTGTTAETFNNGTSKNYFDMNMGLLFSGSTDGENNYYLGTSIYHLNRPAVGFNDKNWLLLPRITIHAGGSVPVSPTLTLHASAIHQMQNQATETTFGAAIAASIGGDPNKTSNFYIGSWYRFKDAIIPYLGLEFNNLRIGATYDVNTSSLKTATQSKGGMEISLIYIKRAAETMGVPCPKF